MLLELSKGENVDLRRLAVNALAGIHSERQQVIPGLIERLEDPDSVVARGAALDIGAYGAAASNAVADLVKAKESKHRQVRDAATRALNSITTSTKSGDK